MAMPVKSFVFVHDATSSTWIRGSELRTRLMPMGQWLVIEIVPHGTRIDEVRCDVLDGCPTVSD